MGGLREKMPITFYTMVIGTLAIVGFPGLSGFFSKDEILWKAFSGEHGSFILWLIGVLAAAMTAFYMFRLIFMTFFNECRASEEVKKHIHEAPKTMTVPLMILAVLSIFGGYIGVPESLGGSNLAEHFLDPVIGLGKGKLFSSAGGPALIHKVSETVEHHSFEIEYWLMLLTIVIVFAGILFAYTMYMKKRSMPEALSAANPSVYRLLLNKWYVDELYEKTVINPLRSISQFLWKGIDVVVIDGLVNSTAGFFMKCGVTWKVSQSGNVQRYAVSFLVGVFVLVAYYMYMR